MAKKDSSTSVQSLGEKNNKQLFIKHETIMKKIQQDQKVLIFCRASRRELDVLKVVPEAEWTPLE